MKNSRTYLLPPISMEGRAEAASPAELAPRWFVREWSRGNLLLAWYAATLFLSASLLFMVQPMFAKMALPILGGAPAVWNTCMVFFQATLLVGYGYTHAVTTWLGVRRQAALHLGLLLLPLFTLPIAIPQGWTPPVGENPIPWLLLLLGVSVGLPFFMVSTSAPMLQKWFSCTSHPSAKDPYFLYSASNLGSMLALLGYPTLIESNLRLFGQSWLWAVGYGLLVMLTLGCAVILWRSPVVTAPNPRLSTSQNAQSRPSVVDSAAGLTIGQRVRWVILSFVPSSLMLGVTTYLTTEIPPVPLLWVIPLAIYLLTFILVFAKRQILPHKLMIRALPLLVLPIAICIPLQVMQPLWFFIPLHLLMFFVAAMVCHGELAKSRPPTDHLTEFYLWLSVGGVFGGVFNALAAPIVFKTVMEYPLAIVLACLLVPHTQSKAVNRLARWLDFGLPAALGGLVAGLIWRAMASGLKPGLVRVGLVLGPALIAFTFRHRPIRFGLGVAALILVITFSGESRNRVLHAERSFFGVYRVKEPAEAKYRVLFHGSTIHGAQSLDPASRRDPLAYYTRSGPIGQVFAMLSGTGGNSRIAIVGLGTGSMTCYGNPGQEFTFYEIDPSIERIARNAAYFTFLQECPSRVAVVLGDARLSLAKAPDQHYDLIVLDAFSSDAIPVHLLTREALRLQLSKLAHGGILAFHISSRHLDLRPVLGDLAQDAGLVCLLQLDSNVTEADRKSGKTESLWAAMARKEEDLGVLAEDRRWNKCPMRPGARVWTDDFSDILGVIQWKWK